MRGADLGNRAASPMKLRSWKPIEPLRPFIDHFAVREVSLGSKSIYHPLPARSDCFIEFYFADRFRVVNVATGVVHQAPRTVLVGPHAKRREDLIHTGTLKVFHLGFTTTGFSSLFAVPARSIANLAESADAVLGPSIGELEERLASAPSEHWCSIAEHFLLRQYTSRKPAGKSPLAEALAQSLKTHHGGTSILSLAEKYGRSVRQMERIFEEHIGLSPKVFSRVARLHTALQLSNKELIPDWSRLALEAGYFDQSHMIREFRALTGETPIGFKNLQQGTVPDHISHRMSHLSNPASASVLTLNL